MEPIVADWIGLVATLCISWLLSYLAIPVITLAAEKNRLFDKPDQYRKIHKKAVPTFGGTAIFLGFLLSYSVSPFSDSFFGYSYLVGALLVLFFTGLKDDLIVLSAKKKLIAQMLAAGLVIFGSGVQIDSFQGVLGISELPKWFGVALSFFTFVVVINAMNLIDGIDGLAGGIGALASILFGLGFLLANHWPMAVFSFALTGALLGFLRYNINPASIFMGDTGSMILGFLLAVQAIQFMELVHYPKFFALFTNRAPLLTVAFLAFPLYDTLRVVFKRIIRDKSMFTPGRDHVHHELLRMGFSHKQATLLFFAQSLSVASFAIALSFTEWNINIILAAVVLCCLLLFPTNGFKRLVFARIFNPRWMEYLYREHGIDLYPNQKGADARFVTYNLLPDHKNEHYLEKEEKKEETEDIAV